MSATAPHSTPATPAEILIEHLGLEPRATAEIEDLSSRPLSSPGRLELRRAA